MAIPPTSHPQASNPRQAMGAYGEHLAARVLQDQGMHILDRNWRCRHGEIDIVALDGDCLVVCEVKTRRGEAFGEAVEAVSFAKMMRLRRLAVAWLDEHRGTGADAIRIDVIGILRPPAGAATVRHVRGSLT